MHAHACTHTHTHSGRWKAEFFATYHSRWEKASRQGHSGGIQHLGVEKQAAGAVGSSLGVASGLGLTRFHRLPMDWLI